MPYRKRVNHEDKNALVGRELGLPRAATNTLRSELHLCQDFGLMCLILRLKIDVQRYYFILMLSPNQVKHPNVRGFLGLLGCWLWL